MGFRYMFLSSTGIPILIDLTVGSFIAYFYNKPLIHLFRLYNIFLRLYFIHKDELDIAVGAVEVKLDKCLKKLNNQIVKSRRCNKHCTMLQNQLKMIQSIFSKH